MHKTGAKGSMSPFKRLSGHHSREASRDDTASHRRTASGGGNGLQFHSRKSSSGANPLETGRPPVSGSNQKQHRRTTSGSSTGSNFLAEQYERDRQALIKSCFSKPINGNAAPPNNYITHVRIIEDSRYPSSRPGPDTKLEYKKKRILVISSKATSTKDIQLHKGRENSDGTFQIGRTWDIKELTKVERDLEVLEGFTLSLGKNYYWETNSTKERTVFIKSLVTLYMQSFDGHVPELVNWDLSLFYLDDKSYQRALYRPSSRTSSQVSSPVLPQSAQSLNNTYSTGASQYSPLISTTTQPTPNMNANSERSSLNKIPYSTGSTVNDASRRFEIEQHQEQERMRIEKEILDRRMQEKAQQELNRQEQERKIQETAHEEMVRQRQLEIDHEKRQQERIKHEELQRQKLALQEEQLRLEQERIKIEKLKIEDEKRRLREEAQKTPIIDDYPVSDGNESAKFVEMQNDIHNEILEDLNAALTDKNPLRTVHQGNKSASKGWSEVANSIAKVESLELSSLNEPLDLNSAPIAFDEPSNDTSKEYPSEYQEDTTELSYEKDDEARYSQNYDSNTPHVYHEVSTIHEEEQIPILNSEDPASNQGENEKMSLTHRKKKTLDETEDELLLSTLSEIKWDADEDADTLIERLNLHLKETEYEFNNRLISLRNTGSDLQPYRENINRQIDQINPSLSLFLMDLNNFAGDIDYVESQGNGLQVESYNKKRLWKTLDELLKTVSLDENTLNELIQCPIREKYLPWIEIQLEKMLKAFRAIEGDNETKDLHLKEMEALKQRRKHYASVTDALLKKMVDELGRIFENMSLDNTSNDQITSILSTLLVFAPITLFCKEISPKSYRMILSKWNTNIQSLYQKVWETNIESLRKEIYPVLNSELSNINESSKDRLVKQWARYRNTKTPTRDEPVLANIFMKMTSTLDVLEQQCVVYQNFIDKFFHISSSTEFSEFIRQDRDYRTNSSSLAVVTQLESDRDSANIKLQLILKVFQPAMTSLIGLFLDCINHEQTIVPAFLLYLESKSRTLESTNQEFIFSSSTRLFSQIRQIWMEQVQDKLMILERTSDVTAGIDFFPIIRDLPVYIKNQLDLFFFLQDRLELKDTTEYQTTETITVACSKLSESVSRCLSKKNDNNSLLSGTQSVTSESEDIQETINIIINSHWLIETLSLLNLEVNGVFDESLTNIKKIMDEEKEYWSYTLLSKKMPKLTAFVHGASHILYSPSDTNPSRYAAYSKQNLDNVLASYTSNEIPLLVKSLYERTQATFVKEPYTEVRSVLIEKMWSVLQGQTVSLYLKLYTLIDKHYKGSTVRFSKNDIITAFDQYK